MVELGDYVRSQRFSPVVQETDEAFGSSCRSLEKIRVVASSEIMAERQAVKYVDSSGASIRKRTKTIRRGISLEEVEDRRLRGICVFCDEPETADPYLRHKNAGLLMITCDEDQPSRVSVSKTTSAATIPDVESIESETTDSEAQIESESDPVIAKKIPDVE
ncbi:hypothetical protein Bca101_076245 [Brassica carinata]